MTVADRTDGSSRRAPPFTTRDLARDRAFCRAILPRVSRTFAISIRLLSGSFGDAVRTAYLLCRAADAIEDSWPGEPEAVSRRYDLFLAALADQPEAAGELARHAAGAARERPDLELLTRIDSVLRTYRALDDPDREAIAAMLQTMANGMRRYAVRSLERTRARSGPCSYLDTEEELRDYCFVVAGCVGVMLTRLFNRRAPDEEGVEARRLVLARDVGEALQLTNILLDWGTDLDRGRCHVPSRWIEEAGLLPADLGDAARPGVRELAGRIEGLARRALARVPEYLDQVPVRHLRYRLFCLWPARWARASLDLAWSDPRFPGRDRRPKLPRRVLWRIALGATLESRDPWAIRRMLAS